MDAVTMVLALTAVAGLYMAWNIGANDVANAMGTSVGSGALTLRQAIIVAAIFELLGALLVGGNVSETISTGLVRVSDLDQPAILVAAGMASCLIAAAIWLHIASSVGWPVSTTHAIVGGIAGFGLWLGGVDALAWGTLAQITLSWIISPIVGGVIGFGIFVFIRHRVLRNTHPLTAIRRLGPLIGALVFCATTLVAFANEQLSAMVPVDAWLVALGASALGAVGTHIALRTQRFGDDEGVERLFGTLQLVTACFIAFAHGSNDVANAVGPMAAVFAIVQGTMSEGLTVPNNLLIIGAFGIVLGLSTYGFKVMATIGREITELTPSRGFAAEFAAASVIVAASHLGLPVSTTHTIVGAVVGVGMARSLGALNLDVVRRVAVSWVLTVPFCAALAAILVQVVSWIF